MSPRARMVLGARQEFYPDHEERDRDPGYSQSRISRVLPSDSLATRSNLTNDGVDLHL